MNFNLNTVINMFIRLVMRRTMNAGINKGIEMAGRRGKSPTNGTAGAKTAGAKLSPEERAQARTSRDAAKRARQAAAITRRMR